MIINAFEFRVLAMLDGSGPSIPWGSAVGAALDYLKGNGYVEILNDGSGPIEYLITDKGRAALAEYRLTFKPKNRL